MASIRTTSSGRSGDQPPPSYTSAHPEAASIARNIQSVCPACQRTPVDCDYCQPTGRSLREQEAEARRLSHLLLYCMVIDYNCSVSVNVSEADYRLYLGYGDIHKKMNAELETHNESEYEIEYLDWFVQHVDEPCRILKIPSSTVERILLRFTSHQTRLGRYRGCTQSLLVHQGVNRFAEKLWLDRNIILPRVKMSKADVKTIREHLDSCASDVFTHLNGVTYPDECHQCAAGPLPAVGRDGRPKKPLIYRLTEAGKALQSAALNCKDLKPIKNKQRSSTARSASHCRKPGQNRWVNWLGGGRF